MTSHDMIPTRDTGPGLLHTGARDNRDDYDTASYLSSTTLTTPQNTRKASDKQPRSISRVYLSSADEPIGGKSWRRDGEEPRLMSWRRTHDEAVVQRPGADPRRGGGAAA